MKRASITSEGNNHTAIDLGCLDQLTDFSYFHPKLKTDISGKLFTGEILKSTGAEISFQTLPPHSEIGFLHKHREHEEIYIVLKGRGQFQVDRKTFDVSEGSLVRIAPDGERTYRNNSDESMILICIQTRAGTLVSRYIEDGFRVINEIVWKDPADN